MVQIDKLFEASKTLAAVSEALMVLPESEKEARNAAATLAHAQSYLSEMARHLQQGMSPYDALITAARGDLKIHN